MKDLVAKLRIEAEAVGEDKIAAIARELEQLAEQGTAAAPAFVQLANELRALQAEKGDALGGISTSIDAVLGAALGAAPAVGGLAKALDSIAPSAGLASAAGQVGGLASAATGAAPAVAGVASALRDVAQQNGPAAAADDLRDVGDAAGAAQAGLARLDIAGLAADIEQVGLDKLIAEFDRLAAQGGAMAPQFAQAAQELRELQGNAAAGADSVTKIGAEAAGAATQVAGISTAAESLQTKLSQVAAAVAGVFAVGKLQGYAAEMIGVADAYGQMASRIENVTSSTAEYELVQRRLLETAGATYRPLAEAQELYIRTADALKGLGYETEQALDISDSFSYLLVTNAASADKAASAIDAYSKSIQSNKVEADSWSSIMTAMPSVVDALAQSTGKSTAEIRRLGVSGKLAVSDLNEALRQTVESNKAVAASMPTTVADALTNLATAWGAYIGEANRASGVTAFVAEAIDTVTENLDALVGAAMKTGEVLLAAFGAKALIAAKGYVTELLATTTAVSASTSAITRQGAAAATATPQLVGAAAAASKHGQAAATASGAAAAHASSTTRQGAAAATATPQLVGAAAAAARHGQASAAAAGAAAAHAAATTKQGAAAAGAAGGMSSFVGVLGRLKGVGSLLGFTALTLAVSAAIEYGRNLLFAKSAAEELEEALAEAVKAADFSSAEGVDAFIAQLREMQLEADLSAEQISKALSVRLAKIGADELAELRDRLVEAFEAGGQASKELEAALAAVDARLADIEKRANWGRALATEAEAARFALSDLQKQFQAVGTEAEAVGGALKKMLADADLGSLDGIEKLAADLKVVQDSAYATGEQIDGALRERLASLTANELREFGIMAEMAFNQGKLGAEELARINDQVLAASFDKLGVNAATALGKISPAAQEAIVAVDNVVKGLAQAGVEADQAGIAIEMALVKAFASIDSMPALEALLERLKALGEGGKIGAEGLARAGDAAAAARKRIEDMTPGIQSVDEAFRNLGVKSQAELKRLADVAKQSFEFIRDSGKAAPKDIEASFKAYATAAIEANDGVADATIKSQARMLGLKVEADETGKTVVRTMEESAAAAKKLADAAKGAADGVAEVGEAASAASASLVDIAKAQNAAVGAIEGTWLKGAAAASKYANEAREAAWATNKSVAELTASFQAYVSNMEALDRRQNALNSSGARGVEDLKLRLLELNGTEEQIAKARLERDKAEVRRQAAMLEIEARRAQVRGEGGEAKRLREEIKLLEEQLGLLDQIYKAEQRNSKNPDRTNGQSSGGAPTKGSGSASGGGGGTTAANMPPVVRSVFNLNVDARGGISLKDREAVSNLARLIKPQLEDLARRGF